MTGMHESQITRAIVSAYHAKLVSRLDGDVVVVGAGPSGLVAAADLARRGLGVTLLEKRLTPGGGIWGGAMAMNEVVVQDAALELIDELHVKHRSGSEGLEAIDAVELACALSLSAVQAGAVVLNLTFAEDLCVHEGIVKGVVANRTMLAETLPLDPITFEAKAVLDATGHDAALVRMLRERNLLEPTGRELGEGPMDAAKGEQFVVDNVAEVYPGLWVSGMCVVATCGGPRMGPIFGGMLLSGRRAADLIASAIVKHDRSPAAASLAEMVDPARC
jgi:thiamine thiazole synthase